MKKISLIDKGLDLVGLRRKSTIGPLPGDRVIYRSLRELLAAQGQVLTKPYKESVWVYSAINAIATNISRVPFQIKRDIGAGLSKKIEEGALYELFQNPNPLMSGRQLFEAMLIFLGLYGESMWVFNGRDNITQIPKEIWTFSPTRFSPVQNTQGIVVGWEYDSGNAEKIPLANHEVLFFRYFNPYDDIRGLAPIEAAKENINQDYYATRYNSAFFKNGAAIGGFISVEGELTDEQFNRTLKQFEDRHGGYDKAHKIALLEGNGKYTANNISQKDMDYVQGKKMTKLEILAAFKCNEVILGDFSSVKSYDGIKAADKAFWEECLLPKTHYIEDHLWAKFFSHIGQRRGRGKIWGEFDLATVGSLQVNFADKIETAGKMFNMGWPINALNRRLELGMEDVAWGDEWWVPGGFLPVTSLLNGKSPDDSDKPDDEDSDETAPLRSFRKLIQQKEPDLLENISVNESDFRSRIKKFIFDVRKKVLANVYADDFVRPPLKKEFDKLVSDLQKSYFETLSTSFEKFTSELKSEEKVDNKDLVVVAWVSGRIEVVVEKFAELLESLFVALEKADGSKEDNAERVRVVFNALTQKSMAVVKNEINYSQAFGKKLFLQKAFGSSIEYVNREEEEENV